jgi:formate-dependent nitrite reductase cytochrome c552 subunit
LQREKWRGHDRNALCWSFFIVNNNNIVDGSKPQIMRCMNCHVNFVSYSLRTKERKGTITYFMKNGITTLKKHVDADHIVLAKRFEEEMNSPLRNILEK